MLVGLKLETNMLASSLEEEYVCEGTESRRYISQWPMKNDSCMQSRMGMGVTEHMEVVDGTYKELMSVNVIRHVLNLTSSR